MAANPCHDAETARKRALYDARGDFAGRLSFPLTDGLTEHWETRRSVSGRTDQFELFIDGVLTATLGAKLLGLLIAERYRRGYILPEEIKQLLSRGMKRARL